MLISALYLFSLAIFIFRRMSKKPAVLEKHGTCEGIKYLLCVGGDKVTDIKGKVENWIKSEEEDFLTPQHAVAVAKCIGTAAGLLLGDHWMDAQLDTIALTIYDLLEDAETWYCEKDKSRREQMKKDLEHKLIHTYLVSFEKIVKDNGGFFFKQVTWLDIFFVGAIEALEYYLGCQIIDGKFPYLMKLAKKITDMPEVKKYIAQREAEMKNKS